MIVNDCEIWDAPFLEKQHCTACGNSTPGLPGKAFWLLSIRWQVLSHGRFKDIRLSKQNPISWYILVYLGNSGTWCDTMCIVYIYNNNAFFCILYTCIYIHHFTSICIYTHLYTSIYNTSNTVYIYNIHCVYLCISVYIYMYICTHLYYTYYLLHVYTFPLLWNLRAK
jgi:hypothetical protein